ncbi:tyrosine--tRNA ligase [Patescibacteria group bacterium]|nr:tyrosine--tRNA ligase [Patescibacteria group bacterium]MBU4057463.1 tyrosine--tRNA ligase [Patescibacteria group bacterium]MBU4115662.1 tyrosine--tRNA ligase [Patescibacteria group bacterium]
MNDNKKIEEILNRGVEEVFIFDDLKEKLNSGKKLRVKLGVDPTGPKIHIGRAVVLKKLGAFQDLGHKIILIVGDFTAQIGDSSDKFEKRPMLTKKEIKKNLKDYKKQLGKIINLSKAEFKFNSKWLKKLKFQEIAELAESFSVQQMSNRRNFKERIEKGQDISLREFLYPLMQGYDSVIVEADVEIGGSDQLFNLMAGRTIQKKYNQKEQNILTVQMLEGTDGEKMSTTKGNVINITDEPNEIFGKVMSLKDGLITKYFTLCTSLDLSEIEKIKKGIENKEINPRDAKKKLAKEIVAIYHDKNKAEKAEEYFVKTFSKKEIPEEIQTTKTLSGEKLSEALLRQKMISSMSEFKRLVDSDSIMNMSENEKIKEYNYVVKKTSVFKIGKHRFIKIEV